uniref:Uncharacterized protein n=1 Tax=Bactrocera dorsalis TaxID=27457 RepID=A0A034W9P8_BACDO
MPVTNIEMPTITPLSLTSPKLNIAKPENIIAGVKCNSDLSSNVGRRVPNALHFIMETTISEDAETTIQDSPDSSSTTTQLQEAHSASPTVCTTAATMATNKFTRKRQRLYNSYSFINSGNSTNSNDFISKTDYFKAFSK